MKRALLIILTTFVSFNIGAIIVILRKYGIESDIQLVLKAHYDVSIYSLKCGIIGVIVDYITKDWFKKQ